MKIKDLAEHISTCFYIKMSLDKEKLYQARRAIGFPDDLKENVQSLDREISDYNSKIEVLNKKFELIQR